MIRSLRDQRGLTNVELIAASRMSPAYYYQRINGGKAFGLMDIQRLATAIGVHWFEVFRLTAETMNALINDVQLLDRGELAERIDALVGTGRRADGATFDWEELVAAGRAEGVDFTRDDLDALISGRGVAAVDSGKLRLLARFWSIPERYLTELSDREAADLTAALLELRDVAHEIGAQPMAARTVGDMTPEAIRMVTRTLRSLNR